MTIMSDNIESSLPVHFLANSLIGPSTILEPPMTVQYNETSWSEFGPYGSRLSDSMEWIADSSSYVCWSAFRAGKAHFPESSELLMNDRSSYGGDSDNLGNAYSRIVVKYAKENCTGLANTTSDARMLEHTLGYRHSSYYPSFFDGQCEMGTTVICGLYDMQPAKCRLNVRMNAAFILFACLTIKAIYMIAVNLLARGKLKQHCLTFGDVLVASSSDPELRVQGYVLHLLPHFSYSHLITAGNVWSMQEIASEDRLPILVINIAKVKMNRRRVVCYPVMDGCCTWTLTPPRRNRTLPEMQKVEQSQQTV